MKKAGFLSLLLAMSRPAAGADEPEIGPLLLWRVEREGAVSHLADPCQWSSGAVPAPHAEALAGARVIYDAVDLRIEPLRILALAKGDLRISEQVDPTVWDAMTRPVRDTLPAPVVDRLRPWAAWDLLHSARNAAPKAARRSGASNDVPDPDDVSDSDEMLDSTRTLQRSAPSAEVRHFEALEDQIVRIGSLDELYLAVLREWHTGKIRNVVAVGSRDQDACASGVDRATEVRADPVYEELWHVGERAQAWLAALEPDVAQGGAFVAVPTVFLVGEGGLLSGLEARGYAVSRVDGAIRVGDEASSASRQASSRLEPIDSSRVGAWGMRAPWWTSSFCQEDVVVKCLATDAASCRARIRPDIDLCLAQYADRLPPLDREIPKGLAYDIVNCSLSGLIFDAAAAGQFPDDPLCVPLWEPYEAQPAEAGEAQAKDAP